ncbi:MAG: nucleotidyltransferase family protein [Planctomycetota bacterium]|nr:MAG: nucleotidyltransferase family protein [Planctomycetota bacterium]REJ97414.1 MAG: nucleotidyltransferase family protein [Planctomycetota bacterium]REK27674.1 MAG: nucleotidyltransferase family protein [Planctomycetota bacterium]REK38483.1 MAG: nucleotidyltransferase family protein [Planctomycetota bacterium]
MRSFAVIPAAGRGERLGGDKLLLPYGETTLFEHAVATWRASRVDQIVVVARADDRALLPLIRRLQVHAVLPLHAPVDMKASVQLGLDYLVDEMAAQDGDVWLLAPADLPGITAELIDHLLDEFSADHAQALVPTVAGRRGHPVLLPWSWAGAVATLGEDEGINALLRRDGVREVPWPDAAILRDIDTPEDYRRISGDS